MTGSGIDALVAARLVRGGPIPVYLQISEAIRRLLRDVPIPAGTPLPAERVMCERIGISKMTLRQAYGLLERDGLIYCRRGVGTFVSPPRVDKNLPEMRSFSEEMAARGKVASTRLLALRLGAPSPAALEILGLSEGQYVYHIQRLRLADNIPVALEDVQIPAHLVPDLERFDVSRDSIYKILEGHYRIQLGWCNQEISAIPPQKFHRRLLEINTPMALLVIKRNSYTVTGVPIEVAVTAYRGDIYTASIHADRVR